MGVQIFEDRKDRRFWVVGSAVSVNPATLVKDVQRRCKPSSIKLVMITQVEDLWLRVLAPLAPSFFDRYLKPELGLVWLDQTNVLMSVPKQGFLTDLAKALGTMLEREQAKLVNQIRVINSLSDVPMSAEYNYKKMQEFRATSQEFAMLQDTTRAVLDAMSASLTAAARKN